MWDLYKMLIPHVMKWRHILSCCGKQHLQLPSQWLYGMKVQNCEHFYLEDKHD